MVVVASSGIVGDFGLWTGVTPATGFFRGETGVGGARPGGTLTGTLTGDRNGLMGPGSCRVGLRGTGPEGEVSELMVNGSMATLRGGMLPARVLGEPGKVGRAGNEGCFCSGGTRVPPMGGRGTPLMGERGAPPRDGRGLVVRNGGTGGDRGEREGLAVAPPSSLVTSSSDET